MNYREIFSFSNREKHEIRVNLYGSNTKKKKSTRKMQEKKDNCGNGILVLATLASQFKPRQLKETRQSDSTYLSDVTSESFFGFQDKSKFPTQIKLPSYSTLFTVKPVSLYLIN